MAINVGRSALPIGHERCVKVYLACEKRVIESEHALSSNNEWHPESHDEVGSGKVGALVSTGEWGIYTAILLE